MKKFLVALIAVVAVANAGTVLAATTTDTVNFEVTAIQEMAVYTGPVTLTINSATPGAEPDDALGLGEFNITTNVPSKIMAKIDSDMPANTTLKVAVEAIAGGTPVAVTLTNIDQVAETGIGAVAALGMDLNYTFSATVAAGVVSGSRTVTYTLTTP